MKTAVLEIKEDGDRGERRWAVLLIDAEGKLLLRTIAALSRDDALTAAKLLKSKGSDAPLFADGAAGDRPGWIVEKTDAGWTLSFTLISSTSFAPSPKAEHAEDEKAIAQAVEGIKAALAKVEKIQWNPPDADPAYDPKESDLTAGEPIPGS